MTELKEMLPRTWLIRLNKIDDLRGAFVKTFSKSMMDKLEYEFDLNEEYYTTSKKDVIRGMHFQLPPFDHQKIVYCLAGEVLDVLLDLRPGPTYGKFCSVKLSSDVPELLVIPTGIAHGFRSLVDGSVLVYKTSSEYAPDYDSGILWNSFNFEWGLDSPILSSRDKTHPSFGSFETPFSAA